MRVHQLLKLAYRAQPCLEFDGRLLVLVAQPLSRAPKLKPLVSSWLLSEWPGWYGAGGAGDLNGDVNAFSSSEVALPIGLVALLDGVPVGFGALKQHSIDSHAHLMPWAAAGYVRPECRGRGIGAFLLHSIVEHAATIGYTRVYCGTSTAIALLRRAGWQEVDNVVHDDKPLTIFRSGP